MPIELRGAGFAYPDGTVAVGSVDLRIEDGERVAIVGQNGAGKTTTVKMMNGLLRPTAGEVLVDGVRTADRTTAETARVVGYVFQNPDDQLFASDVRSEIEYLPRYLKWPEHKREERIARAVDLAGIQDHLDTNPKDLPTAVRKFVAIAAILVSDCRYVILDEPTAGLDSNGLDQLTRMLDRLQAEGVSVVTITHDMRFVVDTFSRVVAMADGGVIADGPRDVVFCDDDVLRRSRIRRLETAQLAKDLGLSDDAVTVDDVVRVIP
ncbi:ABC transporter ATP-binding protein [Microbacterium capsulatum]|uniref:ABC transporter ATP-binding protein n=1 Tax=Microbacterium capsulatum TaxID=3041921 RepID=A0ABU0XJ55_9MICO|nr:ABC transporter ATP-binding protein [Microbacterium sp. ASV81]MDQ4215173.1 ABC transporter ATP-binding protein [Microbacterium sp. ASV81]